MHANCINDFLIKIHNPDATFQNYLFQYSSMYFLIFLITKFSSLLTSFLSIKDDRSITAEIGWAFCNNTLGAACRSQFSLVKTFFINDSSQKFFCHIWLILLRKSPKQFLRRIASNSFEYWQNISLTFAADDFARLEIFS